jgi:gliding motility-associated lipoprotein GldH
MLASTTERKINRRFLALLLWGSLFLSSCDTIDLFEKVESIPSFEWRSDFRPQFKFNIKDTASDYQISIILRHNEQYEFRNVWLNLIAQAPGDTIKTFTLELPLASNDKGWLGTGMDDIYEHRIGLTLDPEKFNFRRPGDYNFTIEQIMRQDPLLHVMNVGLRIEKRN